MTPYVGYAHIFGHAAALADQWNLGDRLIVPAGGYLPFMDTRSDAISPGLCGAGMSGLTICCWARRSVAGSRHGAKQQLQRDRRVFDND